MAIALLLVAWDFVTLPTDAGGLGIRDLRAHNLALVCKLTSNILQASEVPCYNWLAAHYCQRMISMEAHNGGTAIWRCLKSSIRIVLEATTCDLGNGSRISFWIDHWLGCGRLAVSFPVLFSFAQHKFCSVESQFRDGQWDIQLHPNLTATAHRELGVLPGHLVSVQPCPNKGDTRRSAIANEQMSTAYFYDLHSFRGVACPVAANIWDKIIPNRHRLNTRGNMMKKQWTGVVHHNS